MSESGPPVETAAVPIIPTATAAKCEQCRANDAKYKCPGCMTRTCSLVCSKKHKEVTGCSGKRDKMQFVKRADYDANTLMSDYGFLQDIARDHKNTTHDAMTQGIAANKNQKPQSSNKNSMSAADGTQGGVLSKNQRNVVARAKSHRQVQIRYMSPGMQRHQQNRTLWSSSKSRLVWTIEIVVPEISSVPNRWTENGFHDVCHIGDLWLRLLSSDGDTGTASAIGNNDDDDAGGHVGKTESDRPRKRVRGDGVRIQLPSDDNAEYPFKSSIPRELLMALRDRFKNVSLQSLSWLIRVQDVPANTPTLCRIDPCKPLYTQLQYQTVLEFPTIYVYTAPPPKIGMYNVTIQDKPTAFRTE